MEIAEPFIKHVSNLLACRLRFETLTAPGVRSNTGRGGGSGGAGSERCLNLGGGGGGH